MTECYAPCDDCQRPVPVPDDYPLDYAYCDECEPEWSTRNAGLLAGGDES